MKATHFFYTGLVTDLLLLVVYSYSMLSMSLSTLEFSGYPAYGFSPTGKIMAWAVPSLLAILIAIACYLKRAGKVLAANILLWIPALPALGAFMLWAGLVALFIIAGAG